MSIKKDLVIKVSNGVASLDMPLQIYEKDHGIELRFKLMDYKYKYDKDPDNILNSNKEDILEAYTTIVNPSGHELSQINGEVVDDTVKFMIEDSYTDELEEIGIYQLQIHVKCKHSEFSIPPVQFNVLERLKGEKVVTDGDDEVDNSDIIDGSTKFIDDETGKLIIQWQKGDTISSVRLNAMVEVINNAVDEEAQRQLNEVEREQQELEREQQELEREQQELEREQQELERENRLQTALNSVDARVDESMNEYETRFNALTASQELEREQLELERENRLQTALNSVDARVDESMNEYKTRFNALTASQQQDMEVIDARDGEVSLKARLDRDVRNPLQMYEDVEGSYISCDSIDGYAKDVEILGNTIQDTENLTDIRSVGDKVEGQELYKIPVLSRGKNLLGCKFSGGFLSISNGVVSTHSNWVVTQDFVKVSPNKDMVYQLDVFNGLSNVCFYDKDKKFISGLQKAIPASKNITTPNNCEYIKISGCKNPETPFTQSDLDSTQAQLEEGTQATEYEPYQEEKLTILSPTPLEKVGDVADRIICKDGVWGVEKNIEKIYIKDLSSSSFVTWSGLPEGNLVGYYITNIEYKYITPTMLICNTHISNRDASHSRSIALRNPSDGIYRAYISFNKSENINAIADFVNFAQNMELYVVKPTPQFMPLPHDQQVKLRTFANKTNISFLTEIEGTIKTQVPKSIGATVNTHTEQINNLNKELDRVKKLEESTVSTVTTESNFTTVEETANGYFEDVKLEGRTLVNLFNAGGYSLYNNYILISKNKIDFSKLKSNTVYTGVLFDNTNKILYTSMITGNNDANIFSKIYDKVFTFKTPQDLSSIQEKIIKLYSYADNVTKPLVDTDIYKIKFILLEGDHTQNPPEYFEGLKSVGQDVEEVSVESVNGDGNLIDRDFIISKINSEFNFSLTQENNRECMVGDALHLHLKTIINFKPKNNTRYTISCEYKTNQGLCLCFAYTDGTMSYKSLTNTNTFLRGLWTSDSNKTVDKVYFSYASSGKSYIDLNTIQLEIGEVATEYTPRQSNKKPLLYYNPTTETWEKPILRQWDSIEKHSDGKYYYHKRSGEVVLNGSENWADRSSYYISDIQTRFSININAKPSLDNTTLICDKYPVLTPVGSVGDKGENGINLHVEGATIYVTVPKTTLEEFKSALQANPATVVYQLAQEEVYECTNIDLITYENETNLIVNRGAIAPVSTLKVMCNINNVVRELQQKVSNLENYIQHVMINALNNALNE